MDQEEGVQLRNDGLEDQDIAAMYPTFADGVGNADGQVDEVQNQWMGLINQPAVNINSRDQSGMDSFINNHPQEAFSNSQLPKLYDDEDDIEDEGVANQVDQTRIDSSLKPSTQVNVEDELLDDVQPFEDFKNST